MRWQRLTRIPETEEAAELVAIGAKTLLSA